MKDVMASQSSSQQQGVPSFEYSPASAQQPFLFQMAQPLDDLGEMLLSEFAGRVTTRDRVYEIHNVDRPYIKKNYTEVLLKLETAGRVKTDPPAHKRRKGTLGPSVNIIFPRQV
jgi:hypothetical protein